MGGTTLKQTQWNSHISPDLASFVDYIQMNVVNKYFKHK